MKEKMQMWDMQLPVEDLQRLKELAKQKSEESGIKMSSSDIFRHVIAIVVASPGKVAEIMAKRIEGAMNDKSSD